MTASFATESRNARRVKHKTLHAADRSSQLLRAEGGRYDLRESIIIIGTGPTSVKKERREERFIRLPARLARKNVDDDTSCPLREDG